MERLSYSYTTESGIVRCADVKIGTIGSRVRRFADGSIAAAAVAVAMQHCRSRAICLVFVYVTA